MTAERLEYINDTLWFCQVCHKDYLEDTGVRTETQREMACPTCGTIEMFQRTYIG